MLNKKLFKTIALALTVSLFINIMAFSDETDKGVGVSEEVVKGTSEGIIEDDSSDRYAREYKGVWISNNAGKNNYQWNTADVMESNLVVMSDGTYIRVENGDDHKIHIEYYDVNFKFLSSRTVNAELPMFGGVHFDGKNYYVVYGQENPSNLDSIEIMRIVEYSLNWDRIGACSVYGANTTKPFRGGSLRMDSDDDYLYILTSHLMYNGHQSNMYVKVNKMTNTIGDMRDSVQGEYTGYVSHSFNQFIKVKGDQVFALDHGDAYPRAAMLSKHPKNSMLSTNTYLIRYFGEIGDNYTNATLGGLELSDSKAITVGSSSRQDSIDKIKKAYITFTDLNNFTSSGTKLVWLTNDSNSANLNNPSLVKINDNRFMVILSSNGDNSSSMNIIIFDGLGNQILSKQFTGKTANNLMYSLSDCQPIYNAKNNKVTWYVTDKEIMRMCYVDASNLAYGEKIVAQLKPIKSVEPSEKDVKLKENETHQLSLILTPKDTTDEYKIEWMPNDYEQDVLSVESNGKITAKKAGYASVAYYLYIKGDNGYPKWANMSGNMIISVDHSWDDGTVVTEPKRSSAGHYFAGLIKYKCLGCGEERLESISADEYHNRIKEKVKPFAERLYSLVLNRKPDDSGLDDWSTRLAKKEITGAEAAYGFFMSDEMTSRGLSNSEYVNICYRTMLGREADESGFNTWVGLLNQGASRLKVLAGFTDSNEFANICGSYGIERGELSSRLTEADNPSGKDMNGIKSFVARCYTKALGREYDEAGLQDWANRIAKGQMSAEEVASDGFFHSAEFGNKNTSNDVYVEILYRTFLGREYDEAGKADWVGKLNSGVSRDEVLYGFSRSAEFANIMSQYGL